MALANRHEIGEFRERVTIERATRTADGFGGQATTWATLAVLDAKVRAVRGRETEELGRTVTAETYLVTIRQGTTPTTTDRVVWSGKTMNIRSVQDRTMRRMYWTLECEVPHGV